MAKIHEEIIVIRLSKLIKNTDSNQEHMVTDDICDALQAVAQELASDSVVVEIDRSQ